MDSAKHSYHLVDPSPWPFAAGVSALAVAFGFINLMHDEGNFLFYLGTGMLLLVAAAWWRDVIREGEVEDHHTPIVQIGLRYGMALFIASEVMFFVAWFWALFDVALYPGAFSPEMVSRQELLGGVWPPANMEGRLFDPWGIPFLNTVILLSSGVTMTWAHHALREDNRRHFLLGLALTIILGITFTTLQVYEYGSAAFVFDDGIYASIFFMATGFHGAHVIIGTIFLVVCFLRGLAGHFTPNHHFGFEAAAWYWYFVNVVWLFLFTCVY
jgi:cytochrome c oxidase subunit 3